jgi:putative pyruvate formate lyase activating enzyme
MKMKRRSFLKKTLGFSGTLAMPIGLACASQKPAHRRTPGYARLEEHGRLVSRISQTRAIFEECRLCPRECGVNRLAGEKGFCRATSRLVL